MAAQVQLFYHPDRRDERIAQFKALGLTKTFDTTTNIFTALATILNHRNPKKCTLVGATEDMLPPASELEVPRVVWIEGLLTLLGEYGVKFVPLEEAKDAFETVSIEALRQYHQVFEALHKAVDSEQKRIKAQNGRVPPNHGRPPYGYVKDGDHLRVERTQAEAVAFIFSQYHDEAEPISAREMAKKVKARFPRKADGKPQFWDDVKVRRILSKARLYCLGEYTISDGQVVQAESLKILPSAWVDIPQKLHEIRQGENGSPSATQRPPAAKKSRKRRTA